MEVNTSIFNKVGIREKVVWKVKEFRCRTPKDQTFITNPTILAPGCASTTF